MAEALLTVKDLKKHFPVKRRSLREGRRSVKAVDGVSFSLAPGQTLGLVGESGCGKSTLGRAAIRLIEPSGGQVIFGGEDITALDGKALRRRRSDFQIVFQDPFSSLNPRMSVGDMISEAFVIQKVCGKREAMERAEGLMETVNLDPGMMKRYPHEFSGGQRQRISIARALAVDPRFLVCDECVSALDVSVQAQIINLMKGIQAERGIAYLFISHDLRIVKYISHQIAVMYLGRIVELAPSAGLFDNTLHPYSRSLLSAIPASDPDALGEKVFLPGDLPSPLEPPAGCHFHTRCPQAGKRCREEPPALRELAPHHFCACHFAG